MRFETTAPQSNMGFNGFVPPTETSMVFVKDSQGRTLLLQDPNLNTQAAYEKDLQELQQRLVIHDWFYNLRNDLDIYTRGYHNEQAMMELVRRRGGVFQTIFETERRKYISI